MEYVYLEATEIPEYIKKKAEVELNETEDRRRQCLKDLKALIREEKQLNADTSDEFLIKFLRTKKFNTKNAMHLLKMYYSQRRKYESLYKNFLPSYASHVMEANIAYFLPQRTEDGTAVWISKFGSWKPDLFAFDDFLKFGLMCMEQVVTNPITQVAGVDNIVDFDGLSWKHFLYITPRIIHRFVTIIQDSFPLRQRSVHIVNAGSLFSVLYNIIKPLLSTKIRRRVHIHGQDFRKLHQYIPRAILPNEYDGLRDIKNNHLFWEQMLRDEERFKRMARYGYKK